MEQSTHKGVATDGRKRPPLNGTTLDGQRMTISEFAALTKRVIARDGFDGYLPTAIYPGRRHVAALEDAPEGAELEAAVLRWATERAEGGEEFLVAFASGPSRFKVIRVHEGDRAAQEFDVADGAV
jgi:hypothetical protein